MSQIDHWRQGRHSIFARTAALTGPGRSKRCVAALLLITAFAIASLSLMAEPSSASASWVNSARWQYNVEWGPKLIIAPTLRARTHGGWDPAGVLREALNKSGRWQWSNTLYNQLLCHIHWAPPWKSTWNLEAKRPDVGYWSTVWALCNPG